MPKLWTDSIEAHRRAVRDATLDSAAALVAERGLRGVTMSQIAEHAGVGRATLYKYFADVDAILVAWHERQVTEHLAQVQRARDEAPDDASRLESVLETYARIGHQHHVGDLAAVLHQGEHVARAHAHLHELVTELIAEGAKAGRLRGDVPARELASYCIHALAAASDMPSKAAVRRLVDVTVAGLSAGA
jgi:AcrR family transcriptional regulator